MKAISNALSTDASVYEIFPERIITPVDNDHLVKYVRSVLKEKKSITMRAGGTSLGGQAIGDGVIIDVSQYLRKVIEYCPDQREVIVESGVIQDDLNELLAADSLRFAPDTSTSNRAMIGGMIGNNSCGSYSVYYGTTREHVKSIDVILSDGTETRFGPLTSKQLNSKLALEGIEGNIYRTVIQLLEQHGVAIVDAFPHPSIIRRNTGYALDVLYKKCQPFNPEGIPFNLAPLICGSEGTLAVIKSATLNLVELPLQRGLLCAHYDSVVSALDVVPELLELNPAAIELIDKPTLDGTLQNIMQKKNRFWIEGDPEAVLVIEFFADDHAGLEDQLLNCQRWLLANSAYAAPVIDTKDTSKVWEVRKAGLGMLMGKITREKAVAVIEDAVVPIDKLSAYYHDIRGLMSELGVNCVYYGHASVGLIHIRPELDLSTSKGKELFEIIAKLNSTLVKKYRGALSGEHGDGRIRAPFLKEQFGDLVYSCLVRLKKAFDPDNLLNPGVIIGDMAITQHLRADRQLSKQIETGFNWDSDISLLDAVEKCNGAGVCRKSVGKGVMCPSYQATRDESLSTRGRSNLLRLALTEDNPVNALSNSQLQSSLELCLGCKGCKTECPASVDMARIKSEILYQATKRFFTGISLNKMIFKVYGKLMVLGSRFPDAYNWVQNVWLSKVLLGIDMRRTLPVIRGDDLKSWWSTQLQTNEENKLTVWVLCDVYSQYQEPGIGRAVFNFLKETGVNIRPIFMKQSPRALISKGLLEDARNSLHECVGQLSGMKQDDIWLGIEPSEILVWRDEAKDLLSAKDNSWLCTKQALLFEELVLELEKKEMLPELKSINKKVFFHAHCHQKALSNSNDCERALKLIPGVNIRMVPSGCCGMSGEFGYQHYDLSKKIAEQILLPTLDEATSDDYVVATGTSCRHQISEFTEYNAMHSAELFAEAIA